MRYALLFTLLCIAAAHADEPTPPARPVEMLAPGNIAVPAQVINSLMIYLSDRSDVARQLLGALGQAAAEKPSACPSPPSPTKGQ